MIANFLIWFFSNLAIALFGVGVGYIVGKVFGYIEEPFDYWYSVRLWFFILIAWDALKTMYRLGTKDL